MKYIAFHMEEKLYRRVIAMKGNRTWAIFMRDICEARESIRAALGKNSDLEPEYSVLGNG